ncbi:MAG: response regulator [Gemmatimonadaceae bacterium]|nr:response regulator [Chitinophagaceae bacterium]
MKILVVDDDQKLKGLFEQRFRREIRSSEMDFVFAVSGEEALTYLGDHEKENIIVLSDMNMSGMSGVELVKTIKSKYQPRPPVVMLMTAYADSRSSETAKTSGADEFLTKPVDFTLLKEKLKKSR